MYVTWGLHVGYPGTHCTRMTRLTGRVVCVQAEERERRVMAEAFDHYVSSRY